MSNGRERPIVVTIEDQPCDFVCFVWDQRFRQELPQWNFGQCHLGGCALGGGPCRNSGEFIPRSRRRCFRHQGPQILKMILGSECDRRVAHRGSSESATANSSSGERI